LELLRTVKRQALGYCDLLRVTEADAQTRFGWPAPREARFSIDPVEHDLSTLEHLLAADESKVQGRARYLLDQNPHLSRALRSRALRWASKWNGADGLLELTQEGTRALAMHQLGARSYSPTALQNFAACPYRFFLQALIRLTPRRADVRVDELDALLRGSLVHEAQFRLLLRLRNENLLRDGAGRDAAFTDVARAFMIMDEVVSDVAEGYRERLAPRIERTWQDAIAMIRADVRGWLERTIADREFTPAYFELSFGLRSQGEARDPRSQNEPVTLLGGLQLRGSVDLVERNREGALRVTDFKTGKVRAVKGEVIQGGAVLQPVFYALALEAMLPSLVQAAALTEESAASTARVVGGRLYYSTHQGAYTAVDFSLDEAARRAAQVVKESVEHGLVTGFLPAAPEEGACTYCDYRDICGPLEEQRVKSKPQRPLGALQKLRAQP
jgi:ATP-dependent helicase/nuclease subunit B